MPSSSHWRRLRQWDARELRFALLRKLAATLREMGMDETASDADKLRHMLNVILTAHPELLYEAQKEALASNVEIEEADEELSSVITSESPLPTSSAPESVFCD